MRALRLPITIADVPVCAVHLVLGAGKAEGAMDAANLLKPMLARGELRMIGATTLDEFRKHIEKVRLLVCLLHGARATDSCCVRIRPLSGACSRCFARSRA